MRASRAEIRIEEIFKENDINFQEEYIFPGLNSSNGRPLRFDFVVFDEEGKIDFLLEYQGKQHYQPSPKFGGAKGFYQQQYNDRLKRRFCAMNGYKLIEISYEDENKISYDYIMKLAYGW